MIVSGLANRKLVGSHYNGHFSPSGTILTKAINSWTIVASRATCIEKGGIHFTAKPLPVAGTNDFTPSDLTRIFRYTKCRWTFGDAGSGTWTIDGMSQNEEFGPEAGHIFRTAGPYTVTLYVTIGGTETSVATTSITVTSADTYFTGAKTVCYSNTTNFTGAPAGSTQIPNTTTFTLPTIGNGDVRVLLEAGGTFTTAVSKSIGSSAHVSHVHIGSYGTGAKPIINATATLDVLDINLSNTKLISRDITIENIHFTQNLSSTITVVGIKHGEYCEDMTVLDCDFDNMSGIQSDSAPLEAQFNISENRKGFIVAGCRFDTPNAASVKAAISCFLGAKYFSFVGNYLKNGAAFSHLLRIGTCQNTNIQHNEFVWNSTNNRHSLKLHGLVFRGLNIDRTPRWNPKGELVGQPATYGDKWYNGIYTEYVYISHNKFTNLINSNGWTVSIGPQDDLSYEECRVITITNNYFTGAMPQDPIHVACGNAEIRDNVVNGLNSVITTQDIATIQTYQYGLDTGNNSIYKNTLYKKNNVVGDTTTAAIIGISTDTTSHLDAENNLLYALPKDAQSKPTSVLNSGIISSALTDLNNVIDPGVYPFTGTNPPSDVMTQFTLVTPGSGADVGDN